MGEKGVKLLELGLSVSLKGNRAREDYASGTVINKSTPAFSAPVQLA